MGRDTARRLLAKTRDALRCVPTDNGDALQVEFAGGGVFVKRPDRSSWKPSSLETVSTQWLWLRIVSLRPVKSGVVESLPLRSASGIFDGVDDESKRQVEGWSLK